MKLGQENTDISLTVDVINDLHISAQPGTSATEYIEVIYLLLCAKGSVN